MSSEQGALPLPGLDEAKRGESALAAAVRRTIAAHQAQAHLGEVDAGACAIALELCAIVQLKQAQRRLSTVSNDLRLLHELLTAMTPDDSEGDSKLRDAMEAWEAQLAKEAAEQQQRDATS